MTEWDKPWNDVADQLSPGLDPDEPEDDLDGGFEAEQATAEADPADVVDQHRFVPVPDDDQR
ncbi:hypothetical protein [Actinokineospora enzanensis]|uniref:hypothetical protein n=1 Tax=Actinokineospora enzanensis TaxID=155975 RepID=UPI00036E79D6|nr:hypothetical protein [Actinokineospora enzanensis]